ncbi:uncharacterized protein LOC116142559 [Pistacia vera]|uniref:uncharacterized protein LOC116142559 n=1 Tax=Pistacia vera TaxID=55513 RepID=UPI001262C905|nr:uncharacterized protein LOC116142559 [Pistacia vera]
MELDELISRESEFKDDPLEGIRNPLNSFKGFLKEISKPEYKQTYPTKIRSEFIPRGVPRMVEISSSESFLNIDCVTNVTDAIEAWETVNWVHIQNKNFLLSDTYKFLRSTLQGAAGSFWRSLEAGTGLLDTVRDLKNGEAIFALFKDMLCREFTGIKITSRNLAEVVALEALTKLRLCDMCLFENFVCEYRRNFYQLPGGTKEVMKNTFFAKLPPGWDKAANEAFKLLLEKN